MFNLVSNFSGSHHQDPRFFNPRGQKNLLICKKSKKVVPFRGEVCKEEADSP